MIYLLESIRVEHGLLHRLPYHEQRIHRAQRALLGQVTIHALANRLPVPPFAQRGLYKCRVIYRQAIEHIEFIPYHPRSLRRLRCVNGDYLDYAHKYEDRRPLQSLFDQRGDADDVLIIRHGRVTDTSYANILFSDGHRWVTPARPLLRGTQRQYLLDRELIREEDIREQSLARFQHFQLVNAFREFNDRIYPISYVS